MSTNAESTRASTAGIASMAALYTAELQELRSAESQLCALLDTLPLSVQSSALDRLSREYGAEAGSRQADLERVLTGKRTAADAHTDQAMRGLVHETHKMSEVCEVSVREAALVASLQRLIHFKIAGYGTVATYARVLGHPDEAARFARYADHDKAVDGALTQIANAIVNPRAVSANRRQPSGTAGNAAASHPRNQRRSRQPGAVSPGVADADKQARTGTVDEPVRNTPPFGDWDDTAK